MPFSVELRSHTAQSPVLMLLAKESQRRLYSLGELEDLSGLSSLDLFDELDHLELAGWLEWRSGDETESVIEVTLLQNPAEG